MIIGINAAAAVKQPRTGVEEYTYQLIKHLTMLPEARGHRFLLYLPSEALAKEGFDFSLPNNFEIKVLYWPLPILWTQIRLVWEMLWRKPDILLIPVHILPFFSPKNSVVVEHGLEYEYFPEYYSALFRWYLCWSTKRSAKKAQRIIAVSKKTKQDLMKFYGCKPEKIEVVHHGVSFCHSEAVGRGISREPRGALAERGECGSRICERSFASLRMTNSKPYILYLGRIETKKNIQGILAAYKILREKYGVPHQLVIAGGKGFGYEAFQLDLEGVLETGYVSEEEKWRFLSGADLFLFPSFCEGFGLPVLEAQAAGVPVVTSYNSSLPEIAGEGAVFVNPESPGQIAEAVYKIFEDRQFRDKIVAAGYENVKIFSWEKCARETLNVITMLKK